MCDPVTAMVAITLAASAVGTVSGLQQANYQAKVGDQNADLADRASVDAIERGKRASMMQQRETSQLQGRQIAAMGANGVDTGFGSALSLQGDTAIIGAEDSQALRENAARESLGYSINASNYRAQAQAARGSKVGIIASGVGDMAGTILSGSKQFGGKSGGKG